MYEAEAIAGYCSRTLGAVAARGPKAAGQLGAAYQLPVSAIIRFCAIRLLTGLCFREMTQDF